MNADPLELQKFGELAHRWWDPESEFRPLHEINPLRLEWINARVPLAGKTVRRRRLRRRHPGRIDGQERRQRHRHRPLGKAAEGGRPAQPRIRRAGALRTDRRRSAGRARARQVRRRHLHGNAGTRARPRLHRPRLRHPGQARRPRVLLDHQPQPQVLPVCRDRRRIRAATCCPRARTTTPSSSRRRNWRASSAKPAWTWTASRAWATTR